MRVVNRFEVCECCYMAVGAGDTSSCDYYGCEHVNPPAAELPAYVHCEVDAEPTDYRIRITCEGCGTEYLPHTKFYTVTQLG